MSNLNRDVTVGRLINKDGRAVQERQNRDKK